MKKLKHIKEINEYVNPDAEDLLFEMANFGQKTTGLPMIVWVSEKRASHAARIKVSRSYNPRVLIGDTFSVSISDNPKIVAGDEGKISTADLKKVFDWIFLNKETLLKYWNNELLTDELIEQIKKV
jgi:hypothetical protein